MTLHVRQCPGCKEERSVEEVFCGNCVWDLTQEPLRLAGQADPIPGFSNFTESLRFCVNGHPVDLDDEMCFTCGATVAEAFYTLGQEPLPQERETIIDGWIVIDRMEATDEPFERFIVERYGHRAILTLYFPDAHPDSAIYEILKRLPRGYVPELLAQGVWECRRYEVVDHISQPNLLNLQSISIDLSTIQQIVRSIGRILSSLLENGLRHCDLRPENIFITHRDPLHLMLGGFHYSRLSTFDLDTVKQPNTARYTAPEVLAGGISVASDWWSLGMVVLQLITNSSCFEGVNEKAFLIHVVTRGVSLPKGIDSSIHLLLRGLLARDPDQRWQWAQIQSWLAGETVKAPSDTTSGETNNGPALDFKDISYTCPKAYALMAAEAANWEQAKDLFLRGVIATWLEERKADSKILAGVRLAGSIEALHEDFRHALALMWLNSSMPLIYRGEIVTSSWMVQNPIQGYELITGPLIGHLRQMSRERHLCDLHDREARARERAKTLEIELHEESFKLLALASSRSNLERQWVMHRRLYPGSDHSGLNALMDRQKTTDEELIILLGAGVQQYQPAEEILSQAKAIAAQAEVPSYGEAAREWFEVSRRDLYREIEERTANYSRCGIARVDEWANDFRIERRIALPRALVLLSIPKESWEEPPRQQYVSTILEFFEKRTASLAQRGPLVRMLITKSSSRIDLAGVASKKPTATSILEHLISRVEVPVGIDRVAFEDDFDLRRRLRHLVSHAKTYRKDTGIDSLYLSFPFLVMQDSRIGITEKKPKIAPILLWPIKIDIEDGDRVSILFDRDREEVRVNPALAGLMSPEEAKRWVEASKELLGRSAIRVVDIMDTFGSLADPRERALCALPDSSYTVRGGTRQVVCSAVLFHAEFMGQAIGEDLRQMRKESPVGTCLETVLRVNKEPISMPSLPPIREKDRFFTMESDPSQEKAVFRARQTPGLLIEGPPGTGKSHTIVNIIGDCIGRHQTVLVVCQKSAALEVLAKRLDAEGLKDRYFYVTHVNRDRTSVVQSLRDQIDGMVQATQAYPAENVEREALAEKIEKLEKEIDKHHAAIHAVDDATGLSYRALLGQLIDLEDQEMKLIDVPALRRLLKDFDQKQLTSIEETCSSMAGIWLGSSFEGSPLEGLKAFSPDSALVNEFASSLFRFIEKEKRRDESIGQSLVFFDVEDPTPHQEWIKSHEPLFSKVNWNDIASWFHLFPKNGESKGNKLIQQLEEIRASINSLELQDHDARLSMILAELPDSTIEEWLSFVESSVDLEKQLNHLDLNNTCFSDRVTQLPISTIVEWLSLARCVLASTSFLSRLNLFTFVKRKRIQKILNDLGESSTLDKIAQLRNALELELQKRLLREEFADHSHRIHKFLSDRGENPTQENIVQLQYAANLELQQRAVRTKFLALSRRVQEFLDCLEKPTQEIEQFLEEVELKFQQPFFQEGIFEKRISMSMLLKKIYLIVDRIIADLYLAQSGTAALYACPRQEEIEPIAKTGVSAYQDLVSRYGKAFERHRIRSQSMEALDRLSPFFSEALLELCQANIRNYRSSLRELQLLVEPLPSLAAYQEFRLQVPNLSPEVLKVFSALREKDKELREYPAEELGNVIQGMIAREARLAWKDRIEQSFPILRLAQKELSRKIHTLDESTTKMRNLNQKFLAFNMMGMGRLRAADWEEITRLRGPRARRLREVIERGWDMGLGRLRPVWLMNPDTASQLLPLRAGMFDVVIFDEASQIPIENALPTLYRAQRAVISGDEKQMPPTSVFMKRISDDEESAFTDEELEDMISDAEREALEDTWNRKEIKDCSDLLALGKTVLPRCMLQIHYRSKYRELIAFSNAAFYGNKLSVPVRHPESVIRNVRPIEMVRVEGVYSHQTNREEAESIVDLLAERWSSAERSSIGVVTFNAKQADLIEDILTERADQDTAFRQALSQERDRQQGGEDMSFFVKNVENVQGDERDVIIFSTTFGRDKLGVFRRQFGLLGQIGGERRLNVAITRAREKVILVSSLPINEISDALSKRQSPKNSRDYLQAYLDYASKLSDGSLEVARKSLNTMTSENASAQCSSNFDKDGFTRSVAAFIKSLGLKPSAITENDAFGLDFVIEDPEKKRFAIGIECDAHCHPVLEAARARELWRPKLLRMEIPHIHRVASYAWYHRRQEEMERLKLALEVALGVMLPREPIQSSTPTNKS